MISELAQELYSVNAQVVRRAGDDLSSATWEIVGDLNGYLFSDQTQFRDDSGFTLTTNFNYYFDNQFEFHPADRIALQGHWYEIQNIKISNSQVGMFFTRLQLSYIGKYFPYPKEIFFFGKTGKISKNQDLDYHG